MEKFKTGLINAIFFIAGDLAYSVFSIGHQRDSATFFGVIIAILLFFILHKLDMLLADKTKKQILNEKKYTNWILFSVLGAGLAFTSNGSILLRWIS